MKLLFDQKLSFKLCTRLADLFPGSQQVRECQLDQADDRTIWKYAKQNGFAVVSQDVGFADLSAVLGSPPKVLWLRCGNQPTTSLRTFSASSRRKSLPLNQMQAAIACKSSRRAIVYSPYHKHFGAAKSADSADFLD